MPFAEGTPTVQIQLGGKVYTLGWTWGAKRRLREFLATKGKTLDDPKAIEENLPAVFWASLNKDQRGEVSIEDLEEVFNPSNEGEIAEKIGSLFKVSEPDPDVKAEPVAAKEPTTGKSTSTSSPQLASTT